MQFDSHIRVSQTKEASSLDPGLLSTKEVIVSEAKGCWLFDASGHRYFDGSGGSGAVNLGHQYPAVIEALLKQTTRLLHTGWNLQSDVRTDAVNKLGAFSPYERCGVLLTVTGAEAIEAAIKIARAHTGRHVLVAFEHSYHGKTAGSLGVTWRKTFKKFNPDSNEIIFAHFPLLHREEDESQPQACLEDLRTLTKRLGDEDRLPAAFMIEPVQASEGILPAGTAFLKGLLELAKSIGSLVVYDEIYTGFGRCGLRFYGSVEGLRPDLMVVGKALGNGLPISAVIGSEEVLEALPPGHHTSTFSGNPLCCAAARAVLDVMKTEEPWLRADAIGSVIKEALSELSNRYSFISQPRGEGLMLGFDCLDREGKPAPEITKALAREALHQKVILRYGGFQESTIKLTPPLLMNTLEVEFLLEALSRAVDAVAERENPNALR